MNNISILAHEKCTGCLLCVEVCPLKCIEMERDSLGFIYPKIDEEKCINCGMCVKKCPELAYVSKRLPKDIVAACCTDRQDLLGSSSGGLATMLARGVVEMGGIYYGAVGAENGQVVYSRIAEVEKINETKGSKYVQSDLKVVYENIREDIMKRKVLFVGTPCQCAAIENLCEEQKDNLIIASFPCGGWTSTKVLQSEIMLHTGDVICDKVIMRDRHRVFVDIYKSGKKISSCKPNDSYFMTALDYKLSVRESCWNCTYSCKERVGDIVLGDFWGYEPTEVFGEKEIKDGISFVGCLSEKGTALMNAISGCLITEHTTYGNVVKANPRLLRKVIEEKHFSLSKRNRFVRNYEKRGLKKAVLRVAAGEHLRRKIRGIIKYKIMRREE